MDRNVKISRPGLNLHADLVDQRCCSRSRASAMRSRAARRRTRSRALVEQAEALNGWLWDGPCDDSGRRKASISFFRLAEPRQVGVEDQVEGNAYDGRKGNILADFGSRSSRWHRAVVEPNGSLHGLVGERPAMLEGGPAARNRPICFLFGHHKHSLLPGPQLRPAGAQRVGKADAGCVAAIIARPIPKPAMRASACSTRRLASGSGAWPPCCASPMPWTVSNSRWSTRSACRFQPRRLIFTFRSIIKRPLRSGAPARKERFFKEVFGRTTQFFIVNA